MRFFSGLFVVALCSCSLQLRAQDVSGYWELEFSIAGAGDFAGNFTLVQEGNPGTVNGSAGLLDSAVGVAGGVIGDSVDFTAFYTSSGGSDDVNFQGTVSGERIIGTVTSVNFGLSGPFVAVRNSGAIAYSALEPCRIADSRIDRVGGAYGAGAGRAYQVKGLGTDLSAFGGNNQGCGIPADASALHVNLTVVGPATSGYLRAWASGKPEPTATVFAWDVSSGATNATPVPLCVASANASCSADLNVKIYSDSAIELVIDVLGYYR